MGLASSHANLLLSGVAADPYQHKGMEKGSGDVPGNI